MLNGGTIAEEMKRIDDSVARLKERKHFCLRNSNLSSLRARGHIPPGTPNFSNVRQVQLENIEIKTGRAQTDACISKSDLHLQCSQELDQMFELAEGNQRAKIMESIRKTPPRKSNLRRTCENTVQRCSCRRVHFEIELTSSLTPSLLPVLSTISNSAISMRPFQDTESAFGPQVVETRHKSSRWGMRKIARTVIKLFRASGLKSLQRTQ